MEQQRSPRRIIIGIILALLAIMLIIILLTRPAKHAAKTGDSQVYNDPVSHTTIVSRKGASPENNGNTATGPVFAGFDKLIDYGITVQQLDALKYDFSQYGPFSSGAPKISLAVDDIQANDHDPNDPGQRLSISSHIVVDRKTSYKIKFYYDGISEVELNIYDATGGQRLYNSVANTATENKETGAP